MSKNIKIKGLDKLIKDLRNLGVKGEQSIEDVTELTAREIEVKAKSLAPVDKGKLRQGIFATPINDFNWKIVSSVKYAAYMEFGTGGLVEVPAELQDIAIKFKGKGIKQINLRPQPYLYPAFIKGRLNYIKDLKAELKRLTKQL